MIGRTLSHFEITAKLGEGGMGEVYQATDSKLGREVAIKVLPEAFVADPERLARFEREAKMLASLNHPQIAAIYEVGEQEGLHFLVMELAEGDTLAERIASGPLPFEEAAAIALQITSALEAAHERGIIHRDLKPANIVVTSDGEAKVLDFGLAKAFHPDVGEPNLLQSSPTLTAAATEMGVILGTAAYMSPEQARGKPVDKRADIWAFGVLLFEMLTGRAAFPGDNVTETLAAVIRAEPDWTAPQAVSPPAVRRVVHRCLQKDPRERFHHSADVRIALEDALAAPDVGAPDDARMVGGRKTRSWVIALSAATLLIGVAAGWFLARTDPRPTSPPALRFVLRSEAEVTAMRNPGLTRDGRRLVYLADGADRLYLHDLEQFASHPLPGTEGARNPFLSPDGRWVAFFSSGRLRRMSLSGGHPVDIYDDVAAVSPGGAWGPGNTILFSKGWLTGLYLVDADGGEPRSVSTPDAERGEAAHWWPQLLPDGRHVLFTIWMAGVGLNDARVGLLDLENGEHRSLFPGSLASYLPSGHLVYYHAGVYLVVPFDVSELRATGEPIAVFEDAAPLSPNGDTFKALSVAANGTLAYVPRNESKHALVWVDRAGAEEPLFSVQLSDDRDSLELSPDGRHLAVTQLVGGIYRLSIYDLERGDEKPLNLEGSSFDPRWHPDGRHLLFCTLRRGSYDVYSIDLEAGGPEEPLLVSDQDECPLGVSRSGERMIYKTFGPGRENFLVMDLLAEKEKWSLLESPFQVDNAVLSPDDRWVAYESDESGRLEIWVQPFSGAGGRIKATLAGGVVPRWSPTSSELFYTRGDEVIVLRFVDREGRFEVLDERVWFRSPDRAVRLAGLSLDAERALIATPEGQLAPPELRVVVGWLGELEGGAVR